MGRQRTEPEQVVNVVVLRAGTRWRAELPTHGVRTYAWTLPGLDQAVRDAIAIAEDLSEEEAKRLRLRFDYHLLADAS